MNQWFFHLTRPLVPTGRKNVTGGRKKNLRLRFEERKVLMGRISYFAEKQYTLSKSKDIFNDEQVIIGIREGGAAAELMLSFLYRQHRKAVQQFILSNSGSEEEAKDVFQDGVIVLFRHIQSGKFRGESSIGTYLFSICKFMWYKVLRKRDNEKPAAPENFEEDPYVDLLGKEKTAKVMELFAELGEACKQVLVMNLYYQYNMEEIAEKLKYKSAQIARNKKHKCLSRLKALVKDRPDIRDQLT